MPRITDDEYEEYLRLKLAVRKDIELASLQNISLEDDIDTPIKKCVMAFALLQCGPQWSCCGFDYYGQLAHKWHQYGRTFFVLRNNEFTHAALLSVSDVDKNGWVIKRKSKDEIDFHINFYNPIPEWDYRECPYYYEPASTYIAWLERFLLSMKGSMLSETILTDTSARYKEVFPAWQYPSRGDWLIRKEDL